MKSRLMNWILLPANSRSKTRNDACREAEAYMLPVPRVNLSPQ